MTGRLTIEFLSDTCFSEPATRNATVDSDVALDVDLLPIAPGKTLHGLLRDTWLTLCEADPNLYELGKALLGHPRSNIEDGKLYIGTARVGDNRVRASVRAARTREIEPLPNSAMALAFLTTRFLTAQDRTTGAPMTETLRLVRVVPAGTELQARLTVRGALSKEQKDLLELLATLTRHLGLDRNRGLGFVQLSVAWEKETPAPALPPLPKVAPVWTFLPVRMTLREPALLTSTELDANSRTSREFVPGSALRGAVAALLESAGADDALLHALLAAGRVHYLNAYPAAEGQRSLPTPLTFRCNKGEPDWKSSPSDEAERLIGIDEPYLETGGEQRTPLETKFYAWSESYGTWIPAKPKRAAHTHQSRDRATGITRKDSLATVYVYDALEEGQEFVGAIALPSGDTALADSLKALLEAGPLFLGRSRKSQYGGLPEVSVEAPTASEPGVPMTNGLSTGQPFVVRLTSDAILRNERGQHDPHTLQAALQKRFGERVSIGRVAVQCVMVRGYSRLYRNELVAIPAAERGSVAWAVASQELPVEELIALQAEPLGERTAEGYGRWAIFTNQTATLLDPKKDAPSEPDTPEPTLLLQAQQRLYMQRLRALLSRKAIELTADAKNPPPPSTTQRLRTALRREDWEATLTTWLTGSAELRLKDTARKKLDACRVDNKKLPDWLVELLAKPDNWPILSSDVSQRLRYRLVSEERSVALWAETKKSLRRHFLDTLLSALAKKAQEEEADR